MPDTHGVIHLRKRRARSMAASWLRSVSHAPLAEESRPILAVANLVCNLGVRLHITVQSTGRKRVSIPPPADLIRMTRRTLLRRMVEAFTAVAIAWPCSDPAESAMTLGALACSYAHDSDLTAVAMILRVAARLRVPHELLDQACLFLLDQQRADGAFGLVPGHAGPAVETEQLSAHINAQMRALVDILSAVDAYADTLPPHRQNNPGRLIPPALPSRMRTGVEDDRENVV